MRRLFGSIGSLVVLVALATGCGSTGDPTTGDDALVLQFMRFDNTGITQADAVGENTAQVDVVQGCCLMGGGLVGATTLTLEPFTATVINAVFRNQEINNIHLDHYTVQIENPESGVGNSVSYPLAGTIIGGRCSNADRACAVDANCNILGTAGTCNFSDTTINDILLFDLRAKSEVEGQLNAVDGLAVPVALTFFGTDVTGNSFRAVGRYTAQFSNFDSCAAGDTPLSLNPDGTCGL